MDYDDIVIGAGMAGMTAALLLARAGRRVAVVEKSPQIAPTVRGFVRDGTYFDTGFHYAGYLGEGEIFRRLLRGVGLEARLEAITDRHGAGDWCIDTVGGFEVDFGAGLERLEAQLQKRFAGESGAIAGYLGLVKKCQGLIRDRIVDLVMGYENLAAIPPVTLADYLDNRMQSPLLKSVFSLHGMLYGSLPRETPLNYHLMVTASYYDESWQIVDGGRALARACESEAARLGIGLMTGRTAAAIDLDETRRVRAVKLEDGEVVSCQNSVYCGHPRLLPDLLPEGVLRPVYAGRLRQMTDTLSAITVYVREREPGRTAAFNSMILMDHWYPDVMGLEGHCDERPVFVSRSVAGNGQGGLSLIVPCRFEEVARWADSRPGRRPPGYECWKRTVAGQVIARLEQSGRVGPLEPVAVATPLTYRDTMHAPNGCLYGAQHGLTEMPLLPQTRLKGLYLSGQAIMTTGVMGAMLAGYLSAGAVLGQNPFRELE